MQREAIILIVLSLAVGGCGKKESEPTKPPTTAKQSVSVESMVTGNPGNQPPPPPPAPVALPDNPAVPPAPEMPAGPEATDNVIAAYNRALSQWIYKNDDVPKDLEALKKQSGLPRLPAAPPGKRIVYVPNMNNPPTSAIHLE